MDSDLSDVEYNIANDSSSEGTDSDEHVNDAEEEESCSQSDTESEELDKEVRPPQPILQIENPFS